ncbi:MAG: TatA/E family twin arginine-targeting protein translocase [Cyanobacteriota bacterium]|nr:TatA/E family twin arginine-targeting protein translocase [Cyanobacteriota bacterium]
MNIFGIGLPEMMLIFVIALLIFGPKKLPEIGRSLGKALRSFQEASNEFQSELKREAQQLEESVKMTAQLDSSANSETSETGNSEEEAPHSEKETQQT